MVVHPRRRPRQFSAEALDESFVQPEDVIRAAEERSRKLDMPRPAGDAALEKLRADCATWFSQLPEPPVYRRGDDPVRAQANALVPQGQELLSRALVFGRDAVNSNESRALIDALKANLEMLVHVAMGRVEKAELAWSRANDLEPRAVRARRLWVRSDESRGAVFDKQTGTSRYDPRPEPLLTVKLACPNTSCQAAGEYQFSPRYATHRFTCHKCRRPFIGYFGEARGVVVTARVRGWKHYMFKLEELDGGLSRIEFEEPSGAPFVVAHRDLLAFLYSGNRELRSVLNLSSSRLLWVQRSGACFVATVAFGEDALELAAFRRVRDEWLLPTKPGRAFVRAYYAFGPGAAAWLGRHERARKALRRGLQLLHQVIQ